MPSARWTGTWLAGGVVVGAALLGVYAAHAAPAARAGLGTQPGAVTLNPASGATSGKPTWSTKIACAAGFQGSAVFREVHADGTTNSVSRVVNGTSAPFGGTLQAPISAIQAAGHVADGGTQELVVICFSGRSLTGTSHPQMSTFITYSANGASYTSGSSPSSGGSPTPSPTSPSGTGSGSRPSSGATAPSPGGTAPPSGATVSTSPSPASPAPSPSPVNSDLAVTG